MKKLLCLFILSLISTISQAQPSEGILIKTRQQVLGIPKDTELIVSDISVNNKYVYYLFMITNNLMAKLWSY